MKRSWQHILTCAATAAMLAVPALAQNTRLQGLTTQNDARAFVAVGRLDTRNVGFCTGTLISPDVVLTAAHCVYDMNTGQLSDSSEMRFRAGLTNGKVAAERAVAQVVPHPGFDPMAGLNAQNVISDVALLRLASPIPVQEVPPFVVHSGPIEKGPVSVVSYGRGRAEALSRQKQCKVLERYARLITMDCDVTFGSSGAPVFTHLNGRGRVLSVVSGMGHRQGQKVSFGMELDSVVKDLKAKMRATAPRPKATVRRLVVGGARTSTGAKFVKP
jgi:protease YdgD